MRTLARSVRLTGVKALATLAVVALGGLAGLAAGLPRSSPEEQGVSSAAVTGHWLQNGNLNNSVYTAQISTDAFASVNWRARDRYQVVFLCRASL